MYDVKNYSAQSLQDEICDIYDALGRPTGRTCLRHAPMAAGDFQLGATVWICNDKNEFLMQKRAKSKKIYPERWAAHGGVALAGERSADAAVREVREELGLFLDAEKLEFLGRLMVQEHGLNDYYFYRTDVDLSTLTLQQKEVEAVCWMSFDEILLHHRNEELLPFMPELPLLAKSIGFFRRDSWQKSPMFELHI